jgi:rhomboid protease GluP
VDDGASRSADLVAKFPGDPRAHFYRAARFINEGDAVAAEQELRTALAEHNVLTTDLRPQFEQGLHMLLALAFLTQGRRDDAKIEAQPACDNDTFEYETVLRSLRDAGICTPAGQE